MGLTDFRPLLFVAVNGLPLGLGPFSAISSVRVSDASGFESDTCEIQWSNAGLAGLFGMPMPGAEIAIGMGSGFNFRMMGKYIADEIEEANTPRTITVTGRAKATGETENGWAPIKIGRASCRERV